MSKFRRITIMLAAAMLLAGIVAQPASAATGAPAFRVTLAKSMFSGDDRVTPIIFRFTATRDMAARGFVRLTIPVRPYTTGSGFPAHGVWGQLQRSDPSAEGYFRVDNGNCRRAKLDGYRSSPLVSVKQFIRVSARCQEGQRFTIAFFPMSRYWNFENDYSVDHWAFPIHTRYEGKAEWKARTPVSLTVAVYPLTIELPSNVLVEPQETVITHITPVIDPPGENPQIVIDAPAIVIGDLTVHKVMVSLVVERPFVTENGRELVLVNPQNLEDDIKIELVRLDGHWNPGEMIFDEVRLQIPKDTFSYRVMLPGESQFVVPTLTMTFHAYDWNWTSAVKDPEGGLRCYAAGGEFKPSIEFQWTCTMLKSKKTQAEAKALLAEFQSYAYCSTKRVELQVVLDVDGERWEYRCLR